MNPQDTLETFFRQAMGMTDPDQVSDLAYALMEWHMNGGTVPDLKAALDDAVAYHKAMNA